MEAGPEDIGHLLARDTNIVPVDSGLLLIVRIVLTKKNQSAG